MLRLPCLLMEQLGLQESVGVGCCGRSAHERLMEALMWPGPSMRSHAELLTGGRLLLVVLGHLPLQHGLLVLLLLQIVLIEGYTCDRSIVIKQVNRIG